MCLWVLGAGLSSKNRCNPDNSLQRALLTVRSALTSQERRNSALNTTKIRDLGNILKGFPSDKDLRTVANNKSNELKVCFETSFRTTVIPFHLFVACPPGNWASQPSRVVCLVGDGFQNEARYSSYVASSHFPIVGYAFGAVYQWLFNTDYSIHPTSRSISSIPQCKQVFLFLLTLFQLARCA